MQVSFFMSKKEKALVQKTRVKGEVRIYLDQK